MFRKLYTTRCTIPDQDFGQNNDRRERQRGSGGGSGWNGLKKHGRQLICISTPSQVSMCQVRACPTLLFELALTRGHEPEIMRTRP